MPTHSSGPLWMWLPQVFFVVNLARNDPSLYIITKNVSFFKNYFYLLCQVLVAECRRDLWFSLQHEGSWTSRRSNQSILKEINPEYSRKDWCWSSNILATWWEETPHWKRLWCWERLKAGREEGDDKGDGWMASPTQWTWVWASSGRWWRTGKSGMLQSIAKSLKETHPATEQPHVESLAGACELLVVTYGMQFPDQELNQGPLNWTHRILATGSPEMSLQTQATRT